MVEEEKKTTIRSIILWSFHLIVPYARCIASYRLTIFRLDQDKCVPNFIAVFVELLGAELVLWGSEEEFQLLGIFEGVEHKLNGLLVVAGQDLWNLKGLGVVPANNPGFHYRYFYGIRIWIRIDLEERPKFIEVLWEPTGTCHQGSLLVLGGPFDLLFLRRKVLELADDVSFEFEHNIGDLICIFRKIVDQLLGWFLAFLSELLKPR